MRRRYVAHLIDFMSYFALCQISLIETEKMKKSLNCLLFPINLMV